MKLPYSILLFLSGCIGFSDVKNRPAKVNGDLSEHTFYDFKVNSIDGREINFSQFRGKKVLIVNTASECGFTPQYDDLQKFHEEFGDQVTVLGFPSNDFGGQEPGSEEEIQAFCRKNFGVTFQLFEKVTVKGKDKHPLYEWLTNPELNGWNKKEPVWNFSKYLINEKGELISFFGPSVGPYHKKLQAKIKE